MTTFFVDVSAIRYTERVCNNKGGHANFILKSANSWAHFAITVRKILRCAKSKIANPQLYMVNPQIANPQISLVFLSATLRICDLRNLFADRPPLHTLDHLEMTRRQKAQLLPLWMREGSNYFFKTALLVYLSVCTGCLPPPPPHSYIADIGKSYQIYVKQLFCADVNSPY